MSALLLLLAITGILAALGRIFRAGVRALFGIAESYMAGHLGQARAQRGDLSGIADAETARAQGRRRRTLASLELVFWVAFLIGAQFTPWPRELYAALNILWLEPRRRPPPVMVVKR